MAYLGRMNLYFREMFPLEKAALSVILMFFSFYLLLTAVNHDSTLFHPGAWFAIVSLFLYFVNFRLNDEVKDEEFDRIHNPDRPMVTGRVRYSDLKLTSVALFAAVVVLNFDRGFVTSAFLLLIVFLMLSARWFYFPDEVREHFVLTTITHQPMIPLAYFYVFAVYNSLTSRPMDGIWTVIGLCLLFSLTTVAWEVSRKIRAPSDETAFPSYSSRWGVRRATLMPMFYLAVTTLGFVLLGIALDFSIFYVAANAVLGIAVLVVFARFLIKPTTERNRLKQANEFYDMGFRILIIIEVLAEHFR